MQSYRWPLLYGHQQIHCGLCLEVITRERPPCWRNNNWLLPAVIYNIIDSSHNKAARAGLRCNLWELLPGHWVRCCSLWDGLGPPHWSIWLRLTFCAAKQAIAMALVTTKHRPQHCTLQSAQNSSNIFPLINWCEFEKLNITVFYSCKQWDKHSLY